MSGFPTSIKVKYTTKATSNQMSTLYNLPMGLYELLRIPFVLSGAPGSFQQFIEEILAEYRDVLCSYYLNDVLVFRRTFTKHIEGIRKVLRKL